MGFKIIMFRNHSMVIMAATMLAYFSKQERIVSDFVYSADSSLSSFDYYSPSFVQDLTIGFWMTAEMKSGITCPFLNINFPFSAATEAFEMRTSSASMYRLYTNSVPMMTFSGTTNFDSFVVSAVVRDSRLSWNYFSFVYLPWGSATDKMYAINSNLGYAISTAPKLRLNFIIFQIGNTNTFKNCLIKFRIHRLDVIEGPYTLDFGPEYDPKYIYMAGMQSFTAIYKLNISPFARNFVNLKDFQSGVNIATIVSPQKSKTEIHFPRSGNQLYRYTFSISHIEIYYDPNVTQISPVDNSYSFFVNYKAFGTNYLAKNCRSLGDCLVPDYIFLFYGRSNLTSPRKFFISASRRWSFKDLFREASYILDSQSQQIYLEKISPPSNYVDFDLSSGVGFVYLTVKNFIFDPSPVAQICFFIKIRICSSKKNLISELRSDDIHVTSSSGQPNSSYIYIFIGEISFHGNADLYFDPTNSSIWTNSYLEEVIFYKDRLDLQRVFNDSFDYVFFDSVYDIGIYNCFGPVASCEFCYYEWCYTCMTGYEYNYDDGTCSKSVAGCDHITRNCISETMKLLNFGSSLNRNVPIFNYNSSIEIFSVIFSFSQSKDLSKNPSGNPNDLRTFYIHYNSLESSWYNSYLKWSYTNKEINTNRIHLSALFHRAATVARMFGEDGSSTYMTFIFVDIIDYILTASLSLFEDNLCFVPNAYMGEMDFNQYSCASNCDVYTFFDSNRNTCVSCVMNCPICFDSLKCFTCDDGYENDEEGQCAVSFGMYFQDRFLNQMLLFNTEYNMDQYLISLRNIKCSAGYVLIGDSCDQCSTGCLMCSVNMDCLKCDSNYNLEGDKRCSLIQSIVLKVDTNSSNENKCRTCFQTQKNTPSDCIKCPEECKCTLKNAAKQNSYIFKCLNVTFSSPFPQVNNQQNQYIYEKTQSENAFNLVTKLKTNLFKYSLDYGLLFNTSYCVLNTTKEYSAATITKTDNKTTSTESKTGQTDVFFSSNDVIILTLTLISGPIGNIVIGFLQFNKIFAFLSLSNENGGQFFEFINVNLYKSKEPDGGFFISAEEKYEYLTEFENRNGDKMVTKFTTFLFVGLLAFQQLLFIVAYIMSKFKNQSGILEHKDSVIQLSFKILRAASYRYNNLFVANLSFLIAHVKLVDTDFHKFLYIAMLLFILYYPTSLYNKAYTYMKSGKEKVNTKYSFFNTLSSPIEWLLNQELLRNRLFDEGFVILKSFLLYQSRKYSKCLLYTALALTVGEFICVLFFYNTVKKGFTVVKLFGILLFAVFTAMMLIASYGFKIPGVLFEVVYLSSNLSKLVEVLLNSLFVFLRNREYSKSLKKTQPEFDVENVY
jgi:hypothetical protein